MELLWLCLAAMAVHYKQLDAAQVAFAALKETDKILYIDAIKVCDLYLAERFFDFNLFFLLLLLCAEDE